MKVTNLERMFIIITSFILNKVFLFWVIGASTMFAMLMTFSLLIFNFMILAKSVDRLIDTYEKAKKKQTSFHIDI
ncbi:MAG: hypothetical protein FWG67_08320 [Defluviitaleaceae bacterium]|nr:hypothetical protein [Defluviitaleaceae bacterium]